MNKPTESLTEPKTVFNLANLPSEKLSSLRETLTQTEAKEWIWRYKKKILELGKKEAFYWWRDTLEDIAKQRGLQAVEDLRARMNSLKEQND